MTRHTKKHNAHTNTHNRNCFDYPEWRCFGRQNVNDANSKRSNDVFIYISLTKWFMPKIEEEQRSRTNNKIKWNKFEYENSFKKTFAIVPWFSFIYERLWMRLENNPKTRMNRGGRGREKEGLGLDDIYISFVCLLCTIF